MPRKKKTSTLEPYVSSPEYKKFRKKEKTGKILQSVGSSLKAYADPKRPHERPVEYKSRKEFKPADTSDDTPRDDDQGDREEKRRRRRRRRRGVLIAILRRTPSSEERSRED